MSAGEEHHRTARDSVWDVLGEEPAVREGRVQGGTGRKKHEKSRGKVGRHGCHSGTGCGSGCLPGRALLLISAACPVFVLPILLLPDYFPWCGPLYSVCLCVHGSLGASSWSQTTGRRGSCLGGTRHWSGTRGHWDCLSGVPAAGQTRVSGNNVPASGAREGMQVNSRVSSQMMERVGKAAWEPRMGVCL